MMGKNMGGNTPKVEIKKAKNLLLNILAFPLCGADVVISLWSIGPFHPEVT
jgi:hypothetical protein